MIPFEIKDEIEKNLTAVSGKKTFVQQAFPVSGGCINSCFCLETSEGKYFLKYNDAAAYPGMFEAEAKGLRLLSSAKAIDVPMVHFVGRAGIYTYIILEWIEGGKRVKDFWKNFGSRLATLHRQTDTQFGLDHDNYIGSLSQSNTHHSDWVSFFISERLEPQLKLAIQNGKMEVSILKQFEVLYSNLNSLLPRAQPSLLHGDLWSGNFLVNKNGNAIIVDPAVYYGHREMDLAMTKLFGGFDPEFYESYHASFPLEKGFENRVDIYNLYPLLVHVNLFGGGYVGQVRTILNYLKI